jgi:hypothetical protein
MEVQIPFQEESKDSLLSGRKTAVSHTSKYGAPGDTFSAFGAKFRILKVIKYPLLVIAKHFYHREGYQSEDELLAVWRKRHPRKAKDPSLQLYLHFFARIQDSPHPKGRPLSPKKPSIPGMSTQEYQARIRCYRLMRQRGLLKDVKGGLIPFVNKTLKINAEGKSLRDLAQGLSMEQIKVLTEALRQVP